MIPLTSAPIELTQAIVGLRKSHRNTPRLARTMVTILEYILFFGIAATLTRQALAAPIRVFIAEVWYVSDVLLISSFLATFALAAIEGRVSLFFGGILLSIWAIISLSFLSPVSVAYGARLILVLWTAFEYGRRPGCLTRGFSLLICLLGALSVYGVFYDNFFGLPWSGAIFEGFGGVKSAVREWYISRELRRIAGFSSASTDAALFISCSFIILYVSEYKFIRILIFILIPVAVYALWLTQQRATMAMFIAVTLLSLSGQQFIGLQIRKNAVAVCKMFFYFGIVVCVLAPFVFYRVDLGGLVGADAPSLYMRTYVVWPAALDRLSDPVALVFGNGLGSVGEAMTYTNPSLSDPPDNLFVYLYTSVGVFSLVIVGAVTQRVRARVTKDTLNISLLFLLTFIVLNGITANILEGMLGSLFLGLVVGRIWGLPPPSVNRGRSVAVLRHREGFV